ncbi:MAG: UvrD-helicase domain-containing protein [Prolixibacteraceae bacterium]|nr:UvrD-helicase domain-containing protein [Prolixibacteraceae bacterium]
MEYSYLQGLNKAQREAVENVNGPSLVIAGAGSGKTRVLTFRIAHLLRLGNPPSRILALTFTNKAAREMKERIASIVGNDIARYLWMGTFHSIFARILRNEAEVIGYPSTYTIYDTADSKSLVRSIITDMQLDKKTYKPGVIINRISAAKNNLVTANAYAADSQARDFDQSIRMPKIADIYKEYCRRCKVSGAMDFDDLLMNTNLLFHNHPDILKKYQDRFTHILVDEYQDTNFSQYLIIKKLAEKHKNLCVVGDDAQSIYSFRGARIENILSFRKDYPGFQTFKLEQNYRSTQNIVNAANSVIQKNKRQLHKAVFSENEPGTKVKILQSLTDNEEGVVVVNELNQHRLTAHDQFADYAILYRTNAQSRIFEEQLRKLGLPYRIYGGLSFYERKEIKDLLAYLRLIVNSNDNEALKRIINFPARGIGKTTLTKLEQKANSESVSIWETACNSELYPIGLNKGTLGKIEKFIGLINDFRKQLIDSSAYEMALSVTRQTGMADEYYKDKTPENLSKFENVQELLNAIQDFSINAREEGRPDKLENYLEDVALITDQDTDKKEDRNKITLMTVHSAKGLEFKNVFVVGLEENLFPSNYSGTITPESLEEERRLFYVALTRAMKNVWLSYARQRYSMGQLNFCEPSRFIDELDEAYVDSPLSANMPSFLSPGAVNKTVFRNRFSEKPGTINRERPTPKQTPGYTQRLTRIKQSHARPAFDADSPDKVLVGKTIEHQRFGRGVVIEIEGTDSNKKATVLFETAGRKQLLLKFAKLKVVG